jgi:hypothetical protein
VKRKRLPVVVDHADPVVDRAVALVQNLRAQAHRPPPTRGHCIDGAPNTGSREDRWAGRATCEAYACKYNLAMQDSASVPGRRHNGLAPEWTLTDRGDASSPSCALDVADLGSHSPAQIAKYTGFDKRRIEQVIKKAREGRFGVELAKMAEGEDG